MAQPQPRLVNSPEFLEDPYRVYALVRESAPVFRLQLDDGPEGGAWLVTRYDDVRAVLSDPRVSSDRLSSDLAKRDRARRPHARVDPEMRNMLGTDPPDHTRLRAVVNRVFTPQRVERLRPRVEAIVSDLLDSVSGEPSWDVMQVLAAPLPVVVIAELLGVPAEEHARLKQLSTRLLPTLEGVNVTDEQRVDSEAAARELTELLGSVVRERACEPRDDLISALLADQRERATISLKELLSTLGLILIAGHETTTNLVGNGAYALLRHADARGRLLAAAGLIPRAIEEILRFDPPVQLTVRVVREPLELHGQRCEPGEILVLGLAAANRDPKHFESPDRFDVGRHPNPHLSFAHGVHFCLGAHLARLEGAVAIGELLRRYPRLRLIEADVERRPTPLLRGFQKLPVAV